jgi:F-type H+-transporting ATPase subunit c
MKKLNLVLGAGAAFALPVLAMAEEPVAAAATAAADGRPFYAIAKGFAVGVAALACAFAQGKIVSSAVEGISRNPGAAGQVFTPMLLGVAFVETLLIFTLFLSGINP